MIIYKSLGSVEVDYDKKVVRTEGGTIDFGRISHYVFEYVKTAWVDRDKEDSDSRDHAVFLYETMRVNGTFEELPDFDPDEERRGALLYEVGLQLWYFYDQDSEVKSSSLDFSQKDAFEARRKLKPLIKHLSSQCLP